MSKRRLNSSQHHGTKGYAVFKWPHRTLRQTWDVWHNGICIAEFPTHAEAITYAQEHAKIEALKEPS